MSTSDLAAINAMLQLYFDGLQHSDTARLREVFHPQACYACATEGRLVHLGMAEYFALVDRRPAPSSQGHVRTDRIVRIEFAGPVTALAQVECSIPHKAFTDFLSLVKIDGRWTILAKLFHWEQR